ncbi:hypothetical protein SMC26_39920 [Actinomadura fulvescens]|uniref:Uncharacterized protein n=1 Tax=Actinomadura fulvescens TaxID=46160 RepID=A0ABP6DBC8_9ACTN
MMTVAETIAGAAVVRLSSGGPELFAWDVEYRGRRDYGQGGVTDDKTRAFTCVTLALLGSPLGSHGRVRRVTLSPSGEVAHLELGVLGQAFRSRDGVRWTDQP